MRKACLVCIQLLLVVLAVILRAILVASTACCLVLRSIACGWEASGEVLDGMRNILRKRG